MCDGEQVELPYLLLRLGAVQRVITMIGQVAYTEVAMLSPRLRRDMHVIWCCLTGQELRGEPEVVPDAVLEYLCSVRNTPLHIAASHGHVEVCGILVKHGADTEARRAKGVDQTRVGVGFWVPLACLHVCPVGCIVRVDTQTKSN